MPYGRSIPTHLVRCLLLLAAAGSLRAQSPAIPLGIPWQAGQPGHIHSGAERDAQLPGRGGLAELDFSYFSLTVQPADSVWSLQPHASLQPMAATPLALALARPLSAPYQIGSDSAWARFCLAHSLSPPSQPDFAHQQVVIASTQADCQARFAHYFYQADGGPLIWLMLDSYGGCRSLRTQSFAFLLPRAAYPPPGPLKVQHLGRLPRMPR